MKQALTILIGIGLLTTTFGIGYAIGAYPVIDLAEQHLIDPGHPREDVPDGISTRDINPCSYTVDFNRPIDDTQVFEFESHDPMLAHEDGWYYLITGTSTDQSLYRSRTLDDPDSWQLADEDYLADNFEFDSLIEVNGTYIAYSNGDVYTAPSIRTDNWTKRYDHTDFTDLGAYHDEDTGLVHVYYEYGDAAGGLSGKKIGHAVSPNGINNWTVYPPVWTAPDGYGVGDFDIIEQNGTLYIFGDYDTHHPRYNVSVWVNTNPYSEFAQLDEPAIAYRQGNTQYADDYGVGDPSLIEHPDGSYLMIANGYAGENAEAKLHYYTGTITSASC